MPKSETQEQAPADKSLNEVRIPCQLDPVLIKEIELGNDPFLQERILQDEIYFLAAEFTKVTLRANELTIQIAAKSSALQSLRGNRGGPSVKPQAAVSFLRYLPTPTPNTKGSS